MKPQVELTLRIGQYQEQVKTVCVPISEDLSRELLEPIEWSDEPLSLILASPGMWGGKGDAITQRKKIFKLRRDVAKALAESITEELIKLFGMNDVQDGYRREDEAR